MTTSEVQQYSSYLFLNKKQTSWFLLFVDTIGFIKVTLIFVSKCFKYSFFFSFLLINKRHTLPALMMEDNFGGFFTPCLNYSSGSCVLGVSHQFAVGFSKVSAGPCWEEKEPQSGAGLIFHMSSINRHLQQSLVKRIMTFYFKKINVIFIRLQRHKEGIILGCRIRTFLLLRSCTTLLYSYEEFEVFFLID